MTSETSANSAILQLNGLRYKTPQALSTTLFRTHKKSYSQRQSYQALETIVFDINTSAFVDCEKSYLKFKIQATGADAGTGAIGSIMNIFRDIRISSKNGQELDRIQSLNEYSVYRTSYELDVDQLIANQPLTGLAGGNANVTTAAPVEFIVPLTWLAGFFNPHVKGQKLPPHIWSGCRVELALESHTRAFISAGACTGYTITSPELVMMEHMPNDSTMKTVTESSQTGLEWTYSRVFTSLESSSNLTVTTDIKKAVSQATNVFCAIHPTASQNLLTADSFLSIANASATSEYQFRLGSMYLPNAPVVGLKESYLMTKQAFKEGEHLKGVATASYPNYSTGGLYAIGIPLQSDNSISSSGLAVNNSATISMSYTGDTNDKSYHLFLVYTALARGFLNSVSVKI